MKKNFPTSYPYLNEHGVSFTRKELREYADYLLDKFKPNSKEYGLEMAYLLLWILDNAKYKQNIQRLLTLLFARIMRRGTFETISRYRAQVEIPDQIDERDVDDFNLLEYQIRFEQLVGDEYSLEELVREDRRKRGKIIKKLQKRAAEWEGTNGS